MAVIQKEKPREAYSHREHLIYFVERSELSWWDHVFRTREGFRHCFLTFWCEWSQRWLVINWRQSKTDFIIMYDFELEKILKVMGVQKATVVRFEAPVDVEEGGPLIAYCSNILSRYLGFGNRLMLTPYALYRKLLKSGGEVVYSWRQDDEYQEQGADSGTEAARPSSSGA